MHDFSGYMDKEILLFLTSIESIGYKTLERIVKNDKDINKIFSFSKTELESDLKLNKSQIDEVLEKRKIFDINKYEKLLNENGIKLVTIFDDGYPDKLREIPDPPLQLFFIGELPKEDVPTVSIIGARNCSQYGKVAARYFAAELAKNEVQVVSGLASGIDGISQEAAVYAGGKSFGVLGSGVDVCYPYSNYDLYEKLKQNGGVISELPPGTKPLPFHFPMRNRIISGLSDILLVVEAKEKSGTFITVTMALEQGKEIFAVPGKITDELSVGCNSLICDGAGIARNVNCILDALKMQNKFIDKIGNNKVLDSIKNDKQLSELAVVIAELIDKTPQTINELYSEILKIDVNVKIQEIQMACFELEINGYTEQENFKISLKNSY